MRCTDRLALGWTALRDCLTLTFVFRTSLSLLLFSLLLSQELWQRHRLCSTKSHYFLPSYLQESNNQSNLPDTTRSGFALCHVSFGLEAELDAPGKASQLLQTQPDQSILPSPGGTDEC